MPRGCMASVGLLGTIARLRDIMDVAILGSGETLSRNHRWIRKLIANRDDFAVTKRFLCTRHGDDHLMSINQRLIGAAATGRGEGLTRFGRRSPQKDHSRRGVWDLLQLQRVHRSRRGRGVGETRGRDALESEVTPQRYPEHIGPRGSRSHRPLRLC
jgi:hypothetical protein